MNKYKRLDLTKLEYECLIEIIDFEKLKEIEKRYKEIEGFSIVNKLNNPKNINFSLAKYLASEKATKVRSNKAKYKIDTAVEILRTQRKDITRYSVAKVSGVSFSTVKRYMSDETLKYLNEKKWSFNHH